jgi:metallophosphoesterase superfamily enzyme
LAERFQRFLHEAGITWLGLTPGNHDRAIPADPVRVHPEGFSLPPWTVCHGHAGCPEPWHVVGHHHPSLRWRGRKVPCFLVSDSSIVLPAMSLDAAGADVDRDPAWLGWRRYAIIDGAVRAVPAPTKKERRRLHTPAAPHSGKDVRYQ